jgi:hypothetical protein
VLLDMTALADEGVLGLGAGEAALGLDAGLGGHALSRADGEALRDHGGRVCWVLVVWRGPRVSWIC